jgi:hypothetical protein
MATLDPGEPVPLTAKALLSTERRLMGTMAGADRCLAALA